MVGFAPAMVGFVDVRPALSVNKVVKELVAGQRERGLPRRQDSQVTTPSTLQVCLLAPMPSADAESAACKQTAHRWVQSCAAHLRELPCVGLAHLRAALVACLRAGRRSQNQAARPPPHLARVAQRLFPVAFCAGSAWLLSLFSFFLQRTEKGRCFRCAQVTDAERSWFADFTCRDAQTFAPKDRIAVCEAIRHAFGTEAAFDLFVREELPAVLRRSKLQYARRVRAAFRDALASVLGA